MNDTVLYDWSCSVCGGEFEEFGTSGGVQVMDCQHCGSPTARRRFPCPVMRTALAPMDKPWEGTPLEGSDGKNPLTFKSEKPFVDLGGG